ncbi:MAG: hypothetical protein RL376_1408 [Verrucomicrobiota bacterium]|jgi:hypothetical protein
MQRIHDYTPKRWRYHQVHILHRHGSEKNLITQNNCSDITLPIFKPDPDGTYVITKRPFTIGGRNRLLGCSFKLELELY